MPVFSGSDPDSWLFRADVYFQIHKLTDLKKLIVEVVSFDGVASDSYRSQEERDPFKDWAELKQRLLVHFRSVRKVPFMDHSWRSNMRRNWKNIATFLIC